MPDIHLDLLDRVSIASPCPAKWDDMIGDDITRHCASCDLDVYDLSAMTRTDAIVFLQSHAEGRLCARIYRRSDGTVLTSDCPVGVAAIRARAVQAAGRAAAALVLLIGGGVLADQASRTPFGRMRLRAVQPIRLLAEQLFPAAPNLGRIPIGARCTGGIVAPFPPPTVPLPPPLPPTPNATDRPTTNGNVHPE